MFLVLLFDYQKLEDLIKKLDSAGKPLGCVIPREKPLDA